ncbi:DNA replication and repair protein RadC [Spirosomataceae bacterium TFI 002]|nr:DNA replication and repair protein RadC [Spirosomataceae bacterium TFI 002]
MQHTTNSKAITTWAEEDRPREKMLLKGKLALSDAELIAILMGSGNREESAVELARSILSTVNYDLNELAKLTIKDLMKFKGVGEAKAISIISALELGRRRKESQTVERPKITCSQDSYEALKPFMLDLPHEEFWIILLDRSNKVLKIQQLSIGGISGTFADPKLIFKLAIENLSSAIILAHNHPSGELRPSQQDLKLTKNLVEAGKLLEINVIDHIIFTNDKYLSMNDKGIMT